VENAAVRWSRVLVSVFIRVPDGDGDELNPPPVFLEDRNEGGVLLGLLCVLLVASEVSRESNLFENEGA
jgi:hypothetical protein